MAETNDEQQQAVAATYRAMIRAMKGATIVDWVELDLTLAQLKVLFVLSDDGVTTIGQVAEHLGIGQPTASHLVDKLVQVGLAARAADPTDRRRAVPRLTPRGEEMVDRLLGGAGALAAALPLLPPADLAALQRSLQRLIAAVHQATADG